MVTDEASLRQDSLQRLAYRAPGFEDRAPKTGARLTEAQALCNYKKKLIEVITVAYSRGHWAIRSLDKRIGYGHRKK